MRHSDIPRFHLHHVSSMDVRLPTGAMVTDSREEMISFNDVLRLRAEINSRFKVNAPTIHTGFGPTDDNGSVTRFRWTWERLTTWNGRMVDTVWVTRVPEAC